MPHVRSKAVSEVWYEPPKKLFITYRDNDRTYLYRQVPASEYRTLLAADSIGQYVNWRIKPQYPFEELDDEEAARAKARHAARRHRSRRSAPAGRKNRRAKTARKGRGS